MDHLPYYIQDDLGAEKPITIPHFGEVTLRASVINVADNIYLIRSGGSGIGVGPTQFGPRRTFYFGINIPLPFGRGPKPSAS
jgi:outer membrane receptor protein involved in Fe transport